MAGSNSIEIEIAANFKDNATDKVKELNAELDKLEKRKVTIEIGANDNASDVIDRVASKLDKLENSDATRKLDEMMGKGEDIADSISGQPITVTPTVDASKAYSGIDSIKKDIESGVKLPISVEDITTAKADAAARSDRINITEQIIDKVEQEQSKQENNLKKAVEDTVTNTVTDAVTKSAESTTKKGMQNIGDEVADRAAEAAGDKIEDTVNGGGLRMVLGSLGKAGTLMGLLDSTSDILESFTADNGLDAARYRARGFTKGGLVGAGALLGSIIPIPGVGAMFGAGVGGAASLMFGDDIGDWISGIHQSAEELKQERLDKIFGNVAMSAKDVQTVVQSMKSSPQVLMEQQTHQQAIQTGYALQESSGGSYYDVAERGGKLNILGNLGLTPEDGDQDAYKHSVEGYLDTAKESLTQSMYNAFMTNDDMFGYGQWDTANLSERYKTAYDEISKQDSDLREYLDVAFSDKSFTGDEFQHVFSAISGMQEIVSKLTPSEADITKGGYDWLSGSGMLSEGSYKAVQEGIWADYDNSFVDIGKQRAYNMATGMDEGTADKEAWSSWVRGTESTLQSSLKAIDGSFANEINTAIAATGSGGLNQFYDQGSKLWMDFSNAADSYMSGDMGRAKEFLTGGFGHSGMMNDFKKTFDWVDSADDEASRAVLSDRYGELQPHLEDVESKIQAAKLKGAETGSLMDELMQGYQIGALSGDESAQEKMFAMAMASNEGMAGLMNKMFGGDTSGMERVMGKDFTDMWSLINGANTDGLKDFEQNVQEARDKIDETGEKLTQVADKAAENGAKAVEDGTKKAEEALKKDATDKKGFIDEADKSIADSMENGSEKQLDASKKLGENIMSALSESLANADDSAFKDSGLGESLMTGLGESLEKMDADALGKLDIGEQLMTGIGKSLENMDEGKLGDLDIGEQLMSSIGTSLEKMDEDALGELNIGEQLMNSIGASLENMDESALGELNIGESLMNSISTSLENMDESALGELNIGESLMNSISASLENMDMESMGDINIGESLMNSISSSLENIDVENIDIGSKIMESISASFESIDFEGLDIGSKIMESISASLESIDIGSIDIGSKIQESINASISESIRSINPRLPKAF